MYPILARFGPFFIYSFTVVTGLSILVSIGLTAWQQKKDQKPLPGWLDAIIVMLVAGIIGGRFIFVIVNWSYYQENIGEMFLVSRGGLNYHGALLTGLLALWLWTARQRLDFASYAAVLAPALAVASALGWSACWLEGCAFGREADFGLFVADLPDSFGVFSLRYQTQLLGFIITVISATLVLMLRRRLRPILLFWFTLLLLSAGRFIITFLRGDPAPILGQIRLDTIADGLLLSFSLLAIIMSYRRRQARSEIG